MAFDLSPAVYVKALNAISERQKITSANLANAQTPGYTAREVNFKDLLEGMNPFETTLSQKMGSMQGLEDTSTGKPVSMQRELIEMQKNTLYYSMVTRLTTSFFSGLKQASQVGR